MDTPARSKDDIVRAVRAVFSSLAKVPMSGSRTITKSIYLAINFARASATKKRAERIMIAKVKKRWVEKKLPAQMITRVERGNSTPSSLNVPAKVGTTKANIKTPITIMAEKITPG